MLAEKSELIFCELPFSSLSYENNLKNRLAAFYSCLEKYLQDVKTKKSMSRFDFESSRRRFLKR